MLARESVVKKMFSWCSNCGRYVPTFRDYSNHKLICRECNDTVARIFTQEKGSRLSYYCSACKKHVPILFDYFPDQIICACCGKQLAKLVFTDEDSFVDDEDDELVYCPFCEDKVTVAMDGKYGWCDKCHRLIM